MSLTLLTFPIVVVCQLAFIADFAFRKPQHQTAERKRDPVARNGILLEAVGFAATWAIGRKWDATIVPMTLFVELIVSAITVLLAATSVWFVHRAVRVLGKQWAYAARLVEGHQLITDGPYGVVRHPIYAGMFGLLIATGISHSRWWAFMFGTVVFLIGTVIRIHSEERLLREAFGAEFEAYTRRVKALIPGVF
jgi:protein-S-isoprenylcysteine O-methyltransferase Ste14